MNRAWEHLDGYLAARRAAGRKLERAEKLLRQFISRLPDREDGQALFTQDQALEWACAPDGSAVWWEARLSAIRPFASYLQNRGVSVEVPEPRLLPRAEHRAVPYMYSPEQLADMLERCDQLFTAFKAATMRTLIGLLAVTGMRRGEALALDVGDLDLEAGTIHIRQAKGGKDRLVFLHDSSRRALAAYLEHPDRPPGGQAEPLFATRTGTRVHPSDAWTQFHRVVQACDLEPQPGARPRMHDLRGTFAVRAMTDSYRDGSPRTPARTLTLLATWLGHADPANTYHYLQAAPELAAIAAARLEPAPTTDKDTP